MKTTVSSLFRSPVFPFERHMYTLCHLFGSTGLYTCKYHTDLCCHSEDGKRDGKYSGFYLTTITTEALSRPTGRWLAPVATQLWSVRTGCWMWSPPIVVDHSELLVTQTALSGLKETGR